MVSYYNTLPYSQKHSSNIPYPPTQPWFSSSSYPPPSHQQFLGEMEPPTHHAAQHMYYNPHVFHQHSPDWPSHESFSTQQNTLLQSNHSIHSSGLHALNQHHGNNPDNLAEGLPSPPITVSGSEMSSPGAPNGASSPHIVANANSNNNNNSNTTSSRQTPLKSPHYDWMKKPSYPAEPNPGAIEICSAPSLQDFATVEPSGKTRTKDKYRVVYTDYQRLELEKEYHTSRYITIRRKTELAQSLQLSERQVKIWFQNRRAKERKQTKKRDDPLTTGMQHHSSAAVAAAAAASLAKMMDTKPKLEPGLHLQHHPLHQMNSMAMSMSPMSLHHSVRHHGHLGVPPPPPLPQHLHQNHQQSLTQSSVLGI